MNYGYDPKTGHLFKGDDLNFFYLGRYLPENLPEELSFFRNHFEGDSVCCFSENDFIHRYDRISSGLNASYLISGFPRRRRVVRYVIEKVMHSEIIERGFAEIGGKKVQLKWRDKKPEFICCCGEYDKKELREVAKENPFASIFFPSVYELCPSLGAVINFSEECPRKAEWATANAEPFGREEIATHTDSSLEGDFEGRMAFAVASHSRALNELCIRPGVKLFYNRIVSSVPCEAECIYFIPYMEVDKYFPKETLSSKRSLAFEIPMLMEPNEEFRRLTKCKEELVTAYVISPFSDDCLKKFSSFYFSIKGETIFCTFDPCLLKDFDGKIMAFRDKRMCWVDEKWIRENYG